MTPPRRPRAHFLAAVKVRARGMQQRLPETGTLDDVQEAIRDAQAASRELDRHIQWLLRHREERHAG